MCKKHRKESKRRETIRIKAIAEDTVESAVGYRHRHTLITTKFTDKGKQSTWSPMQTSQYSSEQP